MRLLVLYFTVLLLLHISTACQDEDLTDEEEKCNSTEYETYVECVRKLRKKRSTDCDSCSSGNCDAQESSSCGQCDCDSCKYSSCQGSCDNCCSTCCESFVPCETNHCCHKTCHAECKTSSCRSSCRKSCYDSIETQKEKIIERIFEDSDSGGSVNSSSVNNNVQNITTIINLKNVINNTNVVDVPINLNYTNQNNISLVEGKDEIITNTVERSANITNFDSNCCIVIGPKQCSQTDKYPYVKCFHTRSKQCGDYCAAPIVHQEEREVCLQTVTGQTTNCKNQILYIPQPQPKCAYQSTWPYVTCGIPNQNPASCEGCYTHYAQPDSKNYQNCPAGCFDGGFGSGPYYRQGPFYQQSFSAVPPCMYIPGGCGGYGSSFGGYGGYGGGYGGYAPPMGMPFAPPPGMNPYGYPMGGSQFPMQQIPMMPYWPQENNTELIDVGKLGANGTAGLFNPVINLMPMPHPYYPSDSSPPKEVEIEVDVDQNASKLEFRPRETPATGAPEIELFDQ